MDIDLVELASKFHEHANPINAGKMSAYMLNQFNFLGISTPLRRELSKEFLRNSMSYDSSQLLTLVNSLWTLNPREFQYIAIDLMLKNHKKFTLKNIPALFDIAIQKSWWDSVDGIAAVINKIMKGHCSSSQDQLTTLLEQAIASENLWIRRIAILHQLGWKESANTERLFKFALQNSADKNFFIRKAIGWSLRDYAKYDALVVYDFVEKNKTRLSSLTVREATKHQHKRLKAFGAELVQKPVIANQRSNPEV